MARLFGTDGIRGKANLTPMDSETVLRLGRAVAHIFRRREGRHRILIGKDTRVSGYMLETALATGISSMGVDVLLVGPLPTPGVAFMTRSMRADAGAMISASHNPYEDNGIKFFGADGFKLDDNTEDEIERLMEPGHLDELRASPEFIGKAFRIDDAIGRYTVYLKSCVEKECKFDGVRIVLDCAHGAAYRVAPLVFGELGAEIIPIGASPNGQNINDGCGSLYPERMASEVKKHNADCGIAYDGDADRVIMCDECGQLLDGDLLLALCAIEFKRKDQLRGGGVVGTVMTNLGLEKALEQEGIKLIRSDVGDRYVLAEMLVRGMNLGGEQSGHLIFLDHNTTGDGILTSLLALAMAVRSGKPLSAFQGIIPRFPQRLINIAVSKKPPLNEVPAVVAAVRSAEQQLGDRGRVLLRYSGTENKARVMVECDDEVLCDQISEELSSAVRDALM